MSVAIFLHSPKVVEGKLVEGMLMYPTAYGSFKSADDQEAFSGLFEGTAPPVPYGDVGKKYGPEKFKLAEVQSAVLQHMKRHYSVPKEAATYWELDGEMHKNLVFHPSALYGNVVSGESEDEAAIRTIWEWTGLRVDHKELVRGQGIESLCPPASVDGYIEPLPVRVYHVKVSIDRAKWEWMNHQGEKRTLTDWDVSPYKDVLADLGIPHVIHNAYCKTHGGPRFIASMGDVKDPFTQRLMAEAGVTL